MLKRAFDVTFAAVLLIVLGPVLVAVAAAVRIKLGAPVLFTQTRPGLGGRPFRLIKFRTMTNQLGPDGQLLPDKDRLTSFGKFLRSSSLDELPALWNVLKGELSFVGPRPLLMQYLPLYNDEQMRRHLVRPGLTGWAQVLGRNSLSWEEKFAADLWYVQHHSFGLDLRILWRTVGIVLRRKGITAAEDATMPPFTGNAS